MSDGFLPWWLGGLVIGGTATLYPLFTGRLLGVSSVYASLFARPAERSVSELEAALLAATEEEFGTPAAREATPDEGALARVRAHAERHRPLFLVGMLLGGAMSVIATGRYRPDLTLGREFDARFGSFGIIPLLVLALSGVLIGIGTRMGGGCTSGHGISGFARGERGSLLTTAVFWSTAAATAWIWEFFRSP